jgi:hypothetical protein
MTKKKKVPRLTKKNRTPDPDSLAFALNWREHLADTDPDAAGRPAAPRLHRGEPSPVPTDCTGEEDKKE